MEQSALWQQPQSSIVRRNGDEVSLQFPEDSIRQVQKRRRKALKRSDRSIILFPFQNNRSEPTQRKLLYDLIRKRTIACQMADAELERTTVTISVSGRTEAFLAVGEVMQFEGFLKVYLEGKDDDSEEKNAGILPKVDIDDPLSLKSATAKQSFTKHPQRDTEASLVQKLDELVLARLQLMHQRFRPILNVGTIGLKAIRRQRKKW